jgi:hypothetical protein
MKGDINFKKLDGSVNWDCADCSCGNKILTQKGDLNRAS